MSELNQPVYIPKISATQENAQQIQTLTLQDALLGEFDTPPAFADPNDPEKVAAQLQKLTQHPEQYSGYRYPGGSLAAYMKTNEWFYGDEAPFVDNIFARTALIATSKLRRGSLRPKAYGVFGLVTDKALESAERNVVIADLLARSIGKAAAHSANVVNIVLHDNDPVTPIAQDLGFSPMGGRGIAAGTHNRAQQRYQRAVEL